MVMIDILQNKQKQSQNGTTLINVEWQPRTYGQQPPYSAGRTQGKKVVIVNQANIQYVLLVISMQTRQFTKTSFYMWYMKQIYNFLSVNENYLSLWKQ